MAIYIRPHLKLSTTLAGGIVHVSIYKGIAGPHQPNIGKNKLSLRTDWNLCSWKTHNMLQWILSYCLWGWHPIPVLVPVPVCPLPMQFSVNGQGKEQELIQVSPSWETQSSQILDLVWNSSSGEGTWDWKSGLKISLSRPSFLCHCFK